MPETGQGPDVDAAERLFVAAALAPGGLPSQALSAIADRAGTSPVDRMHSAVSDRTPGARLAGPQTAVAELLGDEPGRQLWNGPEVKGATPRGDGYGSAEGEGDELMFMPMSSGSGSGSGWGGGSGGGSGNGSGSGSGSGEEPVAGPRFALSTGHVIDPSVPFVPDEIDNYGSNTSDITTTVETWVEDDVSYTATIVDDWTLTITATAGPADLWSYDESLVSVYTASSTVYPSGEDWSTVVEVTESDTDQYMATYFPGYALNEEGDWELDTLSGGGGDFTSSSGHASFESATEESGSSGSGYAFSLDFDLIDGLWEPDDGDATVTRTFEEMYNHNETTDVSASSS